MKETIVIEREKLGKLRNPVLIIGLPGIGLIGQVVSKYMAKELKAKRIAALYSPHFPHQILMTKKGMMRLIRNTFYLYRGKKRDLIILVGDIQAMSSQGQYEVAGKILDYVAELGVKKVITVGGYSAGSMVEQRKIFGVVTNKDRIPKLEKYGIIFGETKGSIVGAAGLIPSIAALRNMEGICLLGETHGGYVDTTAAREIVKLLAKYFDIKISLKRIDERAKKSEKIIKKLEDEIKKNLETAFGQQGQTVSYIR